MAGGKHLQCVTSDGRDVREDFPGRQFSLQVLLQLLFGSSELGAHVELAAFPRACVMLVRAWFFCFIFMKAFDALAGKSLGKSQLLGCV